MSRFEDFVISWKGRDYVIPARSIMAALAKIEDIITLVELQNYMRRGTAPLAKVAQAYGTALRHAGAQVMDEDVYTGMFGDATGVAAEQTNAALMGLLELMVPPEHRRKMQAAAGNLQAQTSTEPPLPQSAPPAAAPSSRKRSKSAAATHTPAGSPQNSSGRSTRKNSSGGSKRTSR